MSKTPFHFVWQGPEPDGEHVEVSYCGRAEAWVHYDRRGRLVYVDVQIEPDGAKVGYQKAERTQHE